MKQSPDRIKVHIARKELLMDDQVYRDILRQHFNGATSSTDLSDKDIKRLIEIFRGKGWAPRQPRTVKNGRAGSKTINDNFRKIPNGPYSSMQRKVLGLWNSLGYDLKKIDARVKKQFGVDRIEWLRDYDHLHVLITDLENRLKSAGAAR